MLAVGSVLAVDMAGKNHDEENRVRRTVGKKDAVNAICRSDAGRDGRKITPRKVYWAGDLFDHKDLIGNLILAEAFEELAQGRWQVVLPQKNEAEAGQSLSIRDWDLKHLFDSDAIIANFDGHDLDSGTVVEFCYAKMLDLPAVLLRTDFRNSNDGTTCPDPWNLMCSGYPRTASLLRPSIQEFHRFFRLGMTSEQSIRAYCRDIARDILEALDKQLASPSFSGDDVEKLFLQYKLAVQSAGGGMAKIYPDEKLRALVERKIRMGIYRR